MVYVVALPRRRRWLRVKRSMVSYPTRLVEARKRCHERPSLSWLAFFFRISFYIVHRTLDGLFAVEVDLPLTLRPHGREFAALGLKAGLRMTAFQLQLLGGLALQQIANLFDLISMRATTMWTCSGNKEQAQIVKPLLRTPLPNPVPAARTCKPVRTTGGNRRVDAASATKPPISLGRCPVDQPRKCSFQSVAFPTRRRSPTTSRVDRLEAKTRRRRRLNGTRGS